MRDGRLLDALTTAGTDRDRVLAVIFGIVVLSIIPLLVRILRKPMLRAATAVRSWAVDAMRRTRHLLHAVVSATVRGVHALVVATERAMATCARVARRVVTVTIARMHHYRSVVVTRIRTIGRAITVWSISTAAAVRSWHRHGGSRRVRITVGHGVRQFLAMYSRSLFVILMAISLSLILVPAVFPRLHGMLPTSITRTIERFSTETTVSVAIGLGALALISALANPRSSPRRVRPTPVARRCTVYWSLGLGGAAGLSTWVALALWGWPAIAIGVLTGITVAFTGFVDAREHEHSRDAPDAFHG